MSLTASAKAQPGLPGPTNVPDVLEGNRRSMRYRFGNIFDRYDFDQYITTAWATSETRNNSSDPDSGHGPYFGRFAAAILIRAINIRSVRSRRGSLTDLVQEGGSGQYDAQLTGMIAVVVHLLPVASMMSSRKSDDTLSILSPHPAKVR